MCGFVGAFGTGASDAPIERMLDSIAARGPDERGTARGDWFCLGACRLAVVAPEAGSQPAVDARSDVTVAFNGELYDYPSLASELRRSAGVSVRSEVELLLERYRRQGSDFVRGLRGDFAIVVVDHRTRTCHLARDPAGVKPLYYAPIEGGATWLVSSEIRGLLPDPRLRLEWDPVSLAEHSVLSFTARDRTLFQGIRQLLPGCLMTVEDRGGPGGPRVRCTLRRFAAEPRPSADPDVDPEAVLRASTDALREAVRAQVRHADVGPVAVALSGGIDSTIVAALAREACPEVVAVTVGDRVDEGDIRYATLVADVLDIPLRVHLLSEAEFLDDVPGIVLSQGGLGPGYMPYLLGQAVRRYVPGSKVLLCGEGADEVFSGYWMHVRPELFARQTAARLRRTDPDLVRASDLLTRAQSWGEDPSAVAYDELVELFATDQLTARHLVPFDHGTMAHGVECRVPYVDQRVVGAVRTLPASARVAGQVSKPLLRLMLADLLADQLEAVRAILSRVPAPAPSATGMIRSRMNRLLDASLEGSPLAGSELAGFAGRAEHLFWLGAVDAIYRRRRGDVAGLGFQGLAAESLGTRPDTDLPQAVGVPGGRVPAEDGVR